MPIYRGGVPSVPSWRFTPLSSGIVTPIADNTYATATTIGDSLNTYIVALQHNDIGAARTVTPRLTIDGNVLVGGSNLVENTRYYLMLYPYSDVVGATTTETAVGIIQGLYARSLKLEFKLNSVADNAHIHWDLRRWII